MRPLNSTDMISLLNTVKDAKGNVFYETGGGDRLDLKSMLNQYVFLAAAVDPESDFFRGGKIICENEKDLPLLAEYM